MTTVNINVYAEPPQTVVNKFYPYWIYVNIHRRESAQKQLENIIKEMQSVNTKIL